MKNSARLFLVLLALFAAGWMVRVFVEKWSFQEHFRTGYLAAQVASSGGNPYRQEELQAICLLPVKSAFTGPPLSLAAYRPFVLWPPNPAYEFWLVLNVALAIVLVRQWGRLSGMRSWSVQVALLLALGFDSALLGELSSGGTCVLEQVLVWSALTALWKGRPWLACPGLIAASFLEPSLMLLTPVVVLAAGRRASALPILCCWAAFGIQVAASFLSHPDWTVRYLELAGGPATDVNARSLLAFSHGLARWALPGIEPASPGPGLLIYLGLVIAALTLAARRWPAMTRAWGTSGKTCAAAFACLTWALLSPSLTPGDFILCLVPALAVTTGDWPGRMRHSAWALLLFPSSWASASGAGLAAPVLQFSPLAAVAVLWAGFVRGLPVASVLEPGDDGPARSGSIAAEPVPEESLRASLARLFETPGRLDLLVLLTLLVLWNSIAENLGINHFDEGMTAYGSEIVAEGGVPYRDFYTPYGPGMFYLVALLYKVFGPALIVLRVLSVLTRCGLALAVFWCARSVAPGWLAALAGLFLSTWMGSFSGMPNPVAMAFATAASAAFLPSVTGRGRPRLFLSGVLMGIAFSIRHDVALPMLLCHAVVGSCFWLRRDDLGLLTWKERLGGLRRDGARHAAGVVLAAAGPVAWVLSQVPVSTLYEQFIAIPTTVYPATRGLVYPWRPPTGGGLLESGLFLPHYLLLLSSWFQYIFPIVVVGFACWVLWQSSRRGGACRGPGASWAGLLFGLQSVLLFNQMAVRPDHWHLLPSMTACILLFVFCIVDLGRLALHRSRLILWLSLALVSLAPGVVRVQFIGIEWRRESLVPVDTPRSQGIWNWSSSAAYGPLIEYLRENVPEGRRIYVGNQRHDRVLECDPMLYFLSGRHSATREFHLIPGVTTRDDVQRKIIGDIEAAGVECIVLFAGATAERGIGPVASGAHTLDRWIRAHFTQVKEFGRWTVWRRHLSADGGRRPDGSALHSGTDPSQVTVP